MTRTTGAELPFLEYAIGIGIAALVLGSYFGALSASLRTFSRSRLEAILEERGRAERIELFTERLPRYQILVGMVRTCLNLVVLLATLYAVEASGLIAPTPGAPETGVDARQAMLEYVVAFAIAGLLVSTFVIALPAAWARYFDDKLVAASMRVLRVLWLLTPIASLLHLFDPLLRRMSGSDEPNDDEDDAAEQLTEEVLNVVEDHEQGGEVDDQQKEMLEGIFDLATTTAGEVMTPRTEMDSIEVTASLPQVKDAIVRMGHSRIPVYEGNLDQIVGVLYAKDLIPFVGDGETFDLRKALRPAYHVPESKSVRELLAEFKQRKVHLAIVLDEYGGTAGLITIEDVLEEIVGEIQDEYEPIAESARIIRIDEHAAEADARVHIDELNEELDLELPDDDDYDTLGGYVSTQLGHIPEPGETFEAVGVRFTVLEADRTRVKRVKIEQLTTPVAEATEEGK